MKRFTLLSLSLIFLFSSAVIYAQKSPVTINLSDGQKTEKDFQLSKIFDGVEYVKLETTQACLLPDQGVTYSVGKQYILAATNTQIYLFDRQGKFLRTIGAKGEGPGEYLFLAEVAIDPEETYILALDYSSGQLLKYDFLGKMIGHIKYKEKLGGMIQSVSIKSTNEIYLLMVTPKVETKGFCLLRQLNSHLEQTKAWFPINTKQVVNDKNDFGMGDFYLLNGSLRFRQDKCDTFFIESAGKMIPRYVFAVPQSKGASSAKSSNMGSYVGVVSCREISGYLVLNAWITPHQFHTLVYNQSTHELSTLKEQQPCGSSTMKPMEAMVNDINGIPSYSLSSVNGIAFCPLQILDLKKDISELCPKKLKITNPGSRKVLADLVSKSDEGDNPIIQIFHVKK